MKQTSTVALAYPKTVSSAYAEGSGAPASAPEAATPRRAPLQVHCRSHDDWLECFRRHLLPLDCSVAGAPSFEGTAVIGRLRDATVAELRVDASRLMRRAIDIGKAEREPAQVVWQLAGRSHVRQGPHVTTLGAGSWTLLDNGREYALEPEQGTRLLVMLLPRAQGPAWRSARHALAALPLPAGGPANIAMAALTAMLRDTTALDPESEATLHDSVVALLERALAIELEARGLGAPAERAVLLLQIHAYILEHLGDAGLNVGRVAAVFGMSRRSLYNVFVPGGVTPHAFIQGARLDRACTLLNQPAWLQAPVAGVARQCGFTDPAHFTRAFHARHGVAPSAWREKAS